MQVAAQPDFVPIEDYLATEAQSHVRHEYLGGRVYAMAGETRVHNTLTLNLALLLRSHLRREACHLYASDIRVNLSLREESYYYYPDVVVTCDPRDSHPRWIHYPKLIVEVLSESTERTDRREKFFAYTTMESLEEYVLVAQSPPEVTVFRRGNNWRAERTVGKEATVRLESLQCEFRLAAVYEGV